MDVINSKYWYLTVCLRIYYLIDVYLILYHIDSIILSLAVQYFILWRYKEHTIVGYNGSYGLKIL